VDFVALHRTAHRLAHHETDASGVSGCAATWGREEQMEYDGTPAGAPAQSYGALEIVGPAEPVRRRKHGTVTGAAVSGPTGSGRESLTTFAAASGEDRAAGAGAHPKTESVLLVPATVVRLERPLAHWNDSGTCLETDV